MECMKCGRETDQSFCEECRAAMKQYPVKPETVVNIPRRSQSQQYQRKVRFHAQISPEVQIEQLKKQIRRLYAYVAVLLLVICALCVGGYHLYKIKRTPLVGQNYTVTRPVEETKQASD